MVRQAKRLPNRRVKGQVDMQPISYLSLPSAGVTLLSDSPSCFRNMYSHTVPTPSVCTDIIQSCLPIGQRTPHSITRQQDRGPVPFLLPLPALTNSESADPITSCSAATVKPGYFLLQMMWTPAAPPTAPPTVTSQHALGKQINRLEEVKTQVEVMKRGEGEEMERRKQVEEESLASPSTLSPLSSCAGEKEEGESWAVVGVVSLNGGENTGGEEEEGRRGGGAGGGGEEETGGGGEGEQGGDGEEDGQREDGGGEREEDGEKDKDEDQDRQGEEEEEEDFDDLTQDEDEEEVMSSASEESVLSVPELQVNRKSLFVSQMTTNRGQQ